MSFSNIIGQDKVCNILKTAKQYKKLAHSYIFTGPESIGKKFTAVEFAKNLNCKDNACDKCFICKNIDKNQYPLVTVFSTEKPSISIDNIKELQKDIHFKQTIPGYRVIIIDDAEKMTNEAGNCFLKTLEEPPANTIIILVTASISRMLKTIISRCQIIRFRELSKQEKIDIISKQVNIDNETLENIFYISSGNIKKTIELINNEDNDDINDFINLEEALNSKNINYEILELLDSISRDKGKFTSWIDFIICKNSEIYKQQNILPDSKIEQLLKIKNYINKNVNPRIISGYMVTRF
jgi:DNA polymerase III subunit delta'